MTKGKDFAQDAAAIGNVAITDDGRKFAAELANAEGVSIPYLPDDFLGERSNGVKRALARLAAAKLVSDVELASAKADLREIDRLLKEGDWPAAHRIAAKHRVETDPLVEALSGLLGRVTAEHLGPALRAELDKRGLVVGVKS